MTSAGHSAAVHATLHDGIVTLSVGLPQGLEGDQVTIQAQLVQAPDDPERFVAGSAYANTRVVGDQVTVEVPADGQGTSFVDQEPLVLVAQISISLLCTAQLTDPRGGDHQWQGTWLT